jgi:hypothetical protein
MPGLVYILCAATSLISATLLLRGALSRGALFNGGGLLFWSSLCFFAMAGNNVLLYMNYVVFPHVDLLMASRLATVVGIVLLNIGLIWHST